MVNRKKTGWFFSRLKSPKEILGYFGYIGYNLWNINGLARNQKRNQGVTKAALPQGRFLPPLLSLRPLPEENRSTVLTFLLSLPSLRSLPDFPEISQYS